jgi:hypothetical protein
LVVLAAAIAAGVVWFVSREPAGSVDARSGDGRSTRPPPAESEADRKAEASDRGDRGDRTASIKPATKSTRDAPQRTQAGDGGKHEETITKDVDAAVGPEPVDEGGNTATRTPELTRSPRPAKPILITISGTVVVWENLDSPAPLDPLNGSFDLTVQSAGVPTKQNVAVENGRFTADVPPGNEVEFLTLDVGGRSAWFTGDLRRPLPGDARLDLVAVVLSHRMIEVVDAASGVLLDHVTVAAASSPYEHPGWLRSRDLLAFEQTAPIDLAPFVVNVETHDRAVSSGSVWIGAPGYAWARVAVDFDHGEKGARVALQPGGQLDFQLHRNGSFSSADLWLELVKDGASIPSMRIPARYDDARDRILPGSYVVRVVQGEKEKPKVLGTAHATIAAGRESDVTIEVAPTRSDAQKVPIRATLVVPESWGFNDGELELERDDQPESESIRFDISRLPVDRVAPRTFLVEASGRPGSWTAFTNLGEPSFFWHFTVESHGTADLRLELGERADLLVGFSESATNELIRSLNFSWSPAGAVDFDWTGGSIPQSQADVPLNVTVGPLLISTHGDSRYAPHVEPLRIHPGQNVHRIALDRPVGVKARFALEDGAPGPSTLHCPIHLRSLDGSGKTLDWRGDGSYDIYVSQPGRYEVTVEPLPGYDAVAPIQVDLTRGELRKIDIPLHRSG